MTESRKTWQPSKAIDNAKIGWANVPSEPKVPDEWVRVREIV